jgi:O-6-methylguanine DNA methyltransferase
MNMIAKDFIKHDSPAPRRPSNSLSPHDVSKILRFLSSPNAGLDFALDIRGTVFQRKVWNALRTIAAGRPLTFAQMACRVPGSKSLRAIGQACADNPIALAIACHRAMGNSGSLSNYRYDARCKRSLINREVDAVQRQQTECRRESRVLLSARP